MYYSCLGPFYEYNRGPVMWRCILLLCSYRRVTLNPCIQKACDAFKGGNRGRKKKDLTPVILGKTFLQTSGPEHTAHTSTFYWTRIYFLHRGAEKAKKTIIFVWHGCECIISEVYTQHTDSRWWWSPCPCPGDQDIYQFTDQVHDTYEASVYVACLIYIWL